MISRLLITRPNPDGTELSALLSTIGIASHSQPLFTIEAGTELVKLPQLLAKAQIVIATSKQIFNFAQKINWPATASYLAIGITTAQVWRKSNSNPIFSPQKESSEGVLQLPQLQNISGKNILILRAQSGREFLAQQLILRGANVQYCECYQRQMLNLNIGKLMAEWQASKLSHWLITSTEQLQIVYGSCPPKQLHSLLTLNLIVVSKRIFQYAQNLGFNKIELTTGASNQAILNSIKLGKKNEQP